MDFGDLFAARVSNFAGPGFEIQICCTRETRVNRPNVFFNLLVKKKLKCKKEIE